jgi:membrane protein required for colicin V production
VAGALSGALRQLVSLAAALLGVAAARGLARPVGEGLAQRFSPYARALAPALLFLGVFFLASLLGKALLRFGGGGAVRGPVDRGAGALLGGAKAAVLVGVVLSAVALAGDLVPASVARHVDGSDFLAFARAHNLVRAGLDPATARRLDRALQAARRARAQGLLERDPDSARLLDELEELQGTGGAKLDPSQAARALEDPEIRALVERLAGRVKDPEKVKER